MTEAADNAAIERIIVSIEATDETRHQHTRFLGLLDSVLKSFCGCAARVDPFGSTVSGFATRESDLDITLNPGGGTVRRCHLPPLTGMASSDSATNP